MSYSTNGQNKKTLWGSCDTQKSSEWRGEKTAGPLQAASVFVFFMFFCYNQGPNLCCSAYWCIPGLVNIQKLWKISIFNRSMIYFYGPFSSSQTFSTLTRPGNPWKSHPPYIQHPKDGPSLEAYMLWQHALKVVSQYGQARWAFWAMGLAWSHIPKAMDMTYIYIWYIYNYTHMEIPRVFLVWKRSANGGFSIDQTVFTSPKVVTLSVGDESIGQILRLV